MSETLPVIEQAQFRAVLGHFATGVAVITAMNGSTPVGMTCGSFTSVSLDPPLVLFCATRTSQSWAGIRAAGHFCANILGEDDEALSRVFSSKADDKFAGVGWHVGASGAPILDAALAKIDCTIDAVHEAGDHDLVLGRVLELEGRAGGPLVFFRGGYGRFSV